MSSVWREVGDRVWVRRYEVLDQTIGVIGGVSGLVVIDTRANHRLADALRDELKQLPDATVGVVIAERQVAELAALAELARDAASRSHRSR